MQCELESILNYLGCKLLGQGLSLNCVCTLLSTVVSKNNTYIYDTAVLINAVISSEDKR